LGELLAELFGLCFNTRRQIECAGQSELAVYVTVYKTLTIPSYVNSLDKANYNSQYQNTSPHKQKYSGSINMKLLAILLALRLALALPSPVSNDQTTELGERQAAASIHDAFVKKGKSFFGTCTDQGLLGGKSASVIQQNFGQVTPENSMKWGSLEANKGQYNWGQADYLANWAKTNNKLIRGHTLIWHSQLPGWVNSISNADTLRQTIKTHVTEVVTRYKGQIAHWVDIHIRNSRHGYLLTLL
jgi:hypothetical protein